MKKLLLPIFLIIISLIVTACGDDEQVTDPATGTTPDTEQGVDDAQDEAAGDGDQGTNDNASDDNANQGTDNSTDLNSKYNFIEFKLEVEVDNNRDAIDVEFEVDHDGTEAKYVDKSQDINLSGNEAMEKLDSIFTAFRFNEESTDDEILDEVYEAFNIPENATEVELDIEFVNGVEREFNR